MKESLDIKMQLLKDYGSASDPKSVDFCREAYKFIMEDADADTDSTESATVNIATTFRKQNDILDNGVYAVYDNGDFYKFTDKLKKKGAAFIGIIHDGHYFGVPFDGYKGKYKLLNCGGDRSDKNDMCVCEADAIMDWDFVKNTEHIKEFGTDIPLNDGEYLPTTPVFLAMYHNREELNKALAFFGADEIDFSEDFWFCQRLNAGIAWLFHGTGGLLSYGGVSTSRVGQAVTLWNI